MVANNKSLKLKLVNFVKALGNSTSNEIYIEHGLLTSQSNEKNFDIIDCSGCIVAPGFIDPQLNGYDDCDFWQFPPYEKIDALRIKLALSGVVAFCPTIITNERDRAIELIEHINSYIKQSKKNIGAKILGIHLEGFFITKYGVHKSRYVQKNLTIDNLKPFIRDNVVIFTLAPELDHTGEAIEFLKNKDILVSIGHSNATFQESEKAINQHKLHCVTHMFNSLKGIEGFSHRGNNPANIKVLESKFKNKDIVEPDKDGIVLSILKNKNVCCMVIADGLHVNKEVVEFLYRIKGKEYFSLVTDMVSTIFFNTAKEHGSLGGGQTSLEKCVSNLVEWDICNIDDALLCASKPISNHLKIANKLGLGSLCTGKEASITLWDTKKNRVRGTIIGENIFLRY